jgi:outer membrane cobalamin receptor
MRQSCSASFLRTASFALGAASPFLVTLTGAAAQVPIPHDSVVAADVPVSLHAGAPAYSVGADVATILAEEIRESSAATLSELLEARVAGLSVLRQSGTTADASRIQTRGIVTTVTTP